MELSPSELGLLLGKLHQVRAGDRPTANQPARPVQQYQNARRYGLPVSDWITGRHSYIMGALFS